MSFSPREEGAEGVKERETKVVATNPCVDGVSPQTKLLVKIRLRLCDGHEVPLLALVDPGAEINLVRKGFIPDSYFYRSKCPKQFVTANHAILDGGLYEVPCEVVLEGCDSDTCEPVTLKCPTSFYDADVRVDALLSYEWLR